MHPLVRADEWTRELVTILAHAYLRLAETSRNGAVSCPATEQNPLDVSAPESPDHVVEPATWRAS